MSELTARLSAATKAFVAALSILPSNMDSPIARVLVLANGLQESQFLHRDQLEKGGKNTVLGPALGWWQFERGGATLGVLRHKATASLAERFCKARGVRPDIQAVWRSLADDDVLAAGMARLLLWTDGLRLPSMGDVEGAWLLYLRTWNPGAYARGDAAARRELRAKFGRNYVAALSFVTGVRT